MLEKLQLDTLLNVLHDKSFQILIGSSWKLLSFTETSLECFKSLKFHLST